MGKYERAIIDYYYWQQEVKRLTREIRKASIADLNSDVNDYGKMIITGGERRCHNVDDSGESCIERLWSTRRVNQGYKEEAECSGLGLSAKQDPEPGLCKCCETVQQLVNERKHARQMFGIQKTKISNLGRGMKYEK